MAIVTRKEFAELCGKSVNYVNTYVVRNQVAVLPNKMIDTENPLNILFKKKCKSIDRNREVEARKERKQKKNTPNPEEEVTSEPIYIYSKKESAEEKSARLRQNEADEEQLSWDARKKRADALQSERKAELSQLQVEKMMGSLMPVDLVEAILRINIQDIFRNFESSCINLASIYCDILGAGDREKLAEITGRLRQELSTIIKRTETSAAQEIENVIADYADSRNRGERK